MKKIALTLGIMGSLVLLAIGCSGTPTTTVDGTTKTDTTVTPAVSEYFVRATIDGKDMEFSRDPEASYSAGLTLVGGWSQDMSNMDITFPGNTIGIFDKTTNDPNRSLGLHLNLQGDQTKSYQSNPDSEGGIPEVYITKYDEKGVTGTFSGKMMQVTTDGYVEGKVIEVSGEFNVPVSK